MTSNDTIKQVDDFLSVEHFDEDARQALLDLGPEAQELLQDYATGSHPSGDPDIQGRAILVLGETQDPAVAVPALRAALTSPDTDIRVRAMRSLGRVGGTEATAALSSAVLGNDVQDAERAHGIRALAAIDTPDARATLETLESSKLSAPTASEVSDALDEMSS